MIYFPVNYYFKWKNASNESSIRCFNTKELTKEEQYKRFTSLEPNQIKKWETKFSIIIILLVKDVKLSHLIHVS